MKKYVISFVVVFLLFLLNGLCHAQFESVTDKTNTYNIGFRAVISGNQQTKVYLKSVDSSSCFVLLDTTFLSKQEVCFIVDKFYESEKSNYKNMAVFKMPLLPEKVFYLCYETRQKVIFLN